MKRNILISAVLILFAAGAARADKLVHVAGGDGPDNSSALQAGLIQPFGVDFGPNGTIYIVEMQGGERLRAIDAKGNLVTLAGSLKVRGYSGDGGPAREATFNGMHSLAVGANGHVYLADTWNNCVRVFDPQTGQVNLFKGRPMPLPAGTRQAPPNAELGGVYCVTFEPTGKQLYICDLDRKRIFRADPESASMTPIAGTGKRGHPLGGQPAVEQPLVDPRAVAVDRQGNVYILERGGHQLRVVGSDGNIRTVAGTGKGGTAGVGGPALEGADERAEASVHRPGRLGVDCRHRKPPHSPLPAGQGSDRAGGGHRPQGARGVGGDPKQAEFFQPHGVIVYRPTGDIYISDAGNDRVLKIIRD